MSSFKKKRNNTVVYTTEKCLSCDLGKQREFQFGDFVYKEIGQCEKCSGNKIITMIYSEKVKK